MKLLGMYCIDPQTLVQSANLMNFCPEILKKLNQMALGVIYQYAIII